MNGYLKIILPFILAVIFLMPIINVEATNHSAVFNLHTTVYDYGQRIDKVEIFLPYKVDIENLSLDTFTVQTNNSLEKENIENGKRDIINYQLEPGNFGDKVILYLDSSLESQYSKTMYWDEEKFSNIPLEINYIIKQNKKIANKPVIDQFEFREIIDSEVDNFKEGHYDDLKYRYFEPEAVSDSHPLIIWLHGAGEGGF